MKALQFVESIPRYLITKAVGAIYRPAFWGPLAMLRYREVPEPTLPGPHWVKVKTRYGGICGSDVRTVLLQDSPTLSVFTSFPFTLGHENVGVIAEVGPAVKGLKEGDRVVVEPLLPCATRGIGEPCEFCRRGEFALCQNFAAGQLAPGLGIGYCTTTGGSWGPYFVAHQSQVLAVPEHVSDENAIMIDAFCSALHPVARDLPGDEDVVLVMGAGVIGLCVVAALRACGSRARVIIAAKYPFQAEMARKLGADEVVEGRKEDLLEFVAQATGGKIYKPLLGKRVLVGGVDLVYECVGSDGSIDDSLRLARSGGKVILVGLAATPKRVDWTPIWLNELTVKGSFWCGTETIQGRRVRAYQQALEWMAEGRLNLEPLVTHRFTLDDYKRALAITTNRGRYGVIKSVFTFE